MFRQQLRSQKGLTLVELMVVVAIIAIIAAVAITMYQDIQKKARVAADNGTVASLRSAVAIYYGRHNGNFPATEAALNALVTPSPPTWACPGQDAIYVVANGKVTLTVTDPC